jgi:hypothetical protein
VFITTEGEKSSNVSRPVLRTGIEYNAIKGLYLRAGVSNNPNQNNFGVGYNFGNFRTDVFVSFNSNIGYSSGIGIVYSPQNIIKKEPSVTE